MYKNQTADGLRHRRSPNGSISFLLPSKDIPKRYGNPLHLWTPLSKASLIDFENNYTHWFQFLRSHYKGRYDSNVDESDTQRSEDSNSQEEDMMPTWQWWMANTSACVVKEPPLENPEQDTRIGTFHSQSIVEGSFNEPQLFVNINDDLPKYDKECAKDDDDCATYKQAHKNMIAVLEKQFPSASSALVRRDCRRPHRRGCGRKKTRTKLRSASTSLHEWVTQMVHLIV
eukprot:TRINITY_DN18679_c0_g1_i1.p1 TRINITY_DN18679_c0_g1~~TRINITY_DN18679_c0_g1_i1.p1  ORF type:complete len:229 (+),score=35.01 TRINITY_DN18679_c0_g1_i1:776-1462(+)